MAAAYRYGFEWFSAEQYRAFTVAYGGDVTEWPGWDVLRRARELTITTWLMQMVDDRAISVELYRRVSAIRNGSIPRRWRAF